jgi:DNA-binding NarL/FixJ family response regulator
VIRILIVDDHPVLRKGVKQILERELERVNCGEAANADEALHQVAAEHWDIVILDISIPGRGGLEVLKDLKTSQPRLPVLIISAHPEDQYGRRVLKAGASGYLHKESAPEELVKAVRKVLTGGRYLSSALAEKLALDLNAPSVEFPHERLSDREFEVLRMIGLGNSISQIAEELGLEITTVSTYRTRILYKMGLSTTAELIHYVIRNHLSD